MKIQVEFNPSLVAGYRLVGYENRMLAAEDFNDDTKDAGELGAGHTVTALYEVVPAGSEVPGADVDALKYQKPAKGTSAAATGELMTVKLRYKAPDGDTSTKISHVISDSDAAMVAASMDFRFAAAVAGFGMLLRKSKHGGDQGWEDVITLASGALGEDPSGQRMEMVVLAKRARDLAAARL